jgi:peptidyl-prolyl cis-trans isomerase D
MLQMFRNFFKSKIGAGLTLAFLVLIAIAFASSDVANSSLGGGVAGDDQVAVVGDRRISALELSQMASAALDQARQNNPTLTMQAFIAQGGLEQALDQAISRTVLAELGRKYDLRAGKRLVDSELAQIPAFQGADGKFDRNAFNAIIGQRNLTEAMVRGDFETNLIVRQLLSPVALAPGVPQSYGARYASLLRERRTGTIALLPSALFAPAGDPSAQQLQAFYTATRNSYIRPERRVIRFAAFGPEAVGTLPAPTAAQVQARYRRDQAKYAAVENRTFTQLVVPTQAAANAIVAEVKGGKPLATAAREKGLATAQVGPLTQSALATAASAGVAQAAFAAASGAIVSPTRGGLGWYVLKVERIDRQSARTLAAATGEITSALAAEQRAAAVADLSARLEEEFDEGRNLAEVAQELKLTLTSTPPVTAAGAVYGKPEQQVAPVLQPLLATAFQMEEAEPQVVAGSNGQQFVIFDVAEITPSAVAPLAEIRSDVVALWRLDQGARAARTAADAAMARVAKGTPLAEAVRAVKVNAPAPQHVSLGREDLARQGQVTPELALFFSMAAGTVKRLQAPRDGGWYVVQLENVQAGAVQPNDPLVLATLRQLASVGGEELVDQFARAAQRELGVERNAEAIAALKAQLAGQGG